MPETPEHFVKIRLRGDDGQIETVWADPVGDLFRIENLPWLAFGVSNGDLVEATPWAPGMPGMYDFVRVVERSGHRLVRVMFEAEGDSPEVLQVLGELGCFYEGANKRYFAVSVPPEVELGSVAQCLISAEVTWEYANPPYEELFPDSL